jgi:hypothetical protein
MFHFGTLMAAGVIHNEVDLQIAARPLFQLMQEFQELPRAVAWQRWGSHGVRRHQGQSENANERSSEL